MHIESEGIETGDQRRPFIARVTIGTKKKRDVLAEFEAPSLAAAEQEADDWMSEYCARVGLGGSALLDRAAMRARWDRLRDGMPNFPEPGEAYLRALEDLAFEGDGQVTAVETPSPRRQARKFYASRSKVVSAVAAARAAQIDVVGIRVWPDGSIAVFDSRGLADKQSAQSAGSAYDDWFGSDG